MKVFKVKYDSGGRDGSIRYQHLFVDERKYQNAGELRLAMDRLHFIGRPKPDWMPPEMWSQYPLHIAPDIWMICTLSGAFAVEPKPIMNIEVLEPMLRQAGEMLPLFYKGRTLIICNILECVDCIDEDKSEWYCRPNTQERLYPERPFFVRGQLPRSTLFKIPQKPLDIYTWEYDHDPETEFKAWVEENGLTGLKFEPMWSDEEGIIPYKRSW